MDKLRVDYLFLARGVAFFAGLFAGDFDLIDFLTEDFLTDAFLLDNACAANALAALLLRTGEDFLTDFLLMRGFFVGVVAMFCSFHHQEY